MIVPDKQQALIDMAMKFVGVHEVGYNDGPTVEIFQSIISKPQHQPWCVDFVQYCVRETDKRFAAETILFATESSQILWLKTPQVARVLVPEPGCIMIWQHFQDETPLTSGHVGIVREVLGNGDVLTVEGNTSPGPGIQREGDGVYLKRRAMKISTGPMRTLGFLLPWAA